MFGDKKKIPSQIDPYDASQDQVRLDHGLQRTRNGLLAQLKSLFTNQQSLDSTALDNLEDQLLMADLGVTITTEILDGLREKAHKKKLLTAEQLIDELTIYLIESLRPVHCPLEIDKGNPPFLIMMIGVNGVGKTTTIGKLANRFVQQKISVMLAAADTFRAAAIEQLQTWGEHYQVPVISQAGGADPAAVIYDGLESARAKKIDVLIADTAGRLHTRDDLMRELEKAFRVAKKFDADLNVERLLVLDASTGQNALLQAREFHQAIGITGIVLSKLDGTAKGGIVFALARELGIPIRFIGVGEQAEDLRPFDPEGFVSALLKHSL